ncbi:MAG: tyrosine-type recombinase/integrase [Pseudomonadota bacterium]
MTEAESKTPKNFTLIDEWLQWLEHGRGRSPRTIEIYSLAMKRLQEFMPGRPLLEISDVELQAFCGIHLHNKGIVAKGRVPYISAVKGFYRWAKSAGHTKRQMASGIEQVKTGRKLPNLISLANAEKLMWGPDLDTFIGIRDAAMMALLMGCGLRVSGLIGINESHLSETQVDKEKRLVLKVMEKGGKERLLPVPKEAEMLVRVYLAHEDLTDIDRDLPTKAGMPQDRVLFVSVRSTKLSADQHRGERRRLTRKAVHDMLQKYGRRLGIPSDQLHPHALRHLFGTELAEDDVHMESVQGLMGHADVKTTFIYVHLAARRKFGSIDKSAPLAKMNTPVSELLKRLPPQS